MMFCKFYLTHKLREVFNVLKMNISTGASKCMSKDQLDAMMGPNLIKAVAGQRSLTANDWYP